ncbi:MAG: helix-turn-helix transcriptional regulator [Alphaproteobacteria bacterium]|nr:helix-turn-helix transcriptional regulator [Alphaproteobacteria bacterium]
MLRHGDIWTAIDRLAEAHNLSASGLARRAGLDPTTFNKSKRFSATRPRWPSTESLSKILEVTGTSLAEFVFYLEPPDGPGWRLPVIPWTAAGEAGRFDETGKPAGDQWSERRFANVADGTAFGVEIGTDEMWPIYSRGDVVIVSTRDEAKPGHRVFVRTRFGEVLIRRLAERGTTQVSLASLSPEAKIREIQTADLISLQRIVMACQ